MTDSRHRSAGVIRVTVQAVLASPDQHPPYPRALPPSPHVLPAREIDPKGMPSSRPQLSVTPAADISTVDATQRSRGTYSDIADSRAGGQQNNGEGEREDEGEGDVCGDDLDRYYPRRRQATIKVYYLIQSLAHQSLTH